MALNVGSVTMTVVGHDEPSANPGDDFKFSNNGSVQGFMKSVGKPLVAAWPVIHDHHADVPGNARFWRQWEGYFSVGISGSSVTVSGSPQATGRFPIDIFYLYNS